MMKQSRKLLISFFSCLLLITTINNVNGIEQDFLYPHGIGVDQLLPQGFEVSSGEIPLKVPIIYYGEIYNSIYVSKFLYKLIIQKI